jgi:hypothetical protein
MLYFAISLICDVEIGAQRSVGMALNSVSLHLYVPCAPQSAEIYTKNGERFKAELEKIG